MTQFSQKLVLCIDDDPALLRMLKITLEAFGYAVLTSDNGVEALHIARQNLVDAVIVDQVMPGCNGAKLSIDLKSASPGTPILMFSGSPPSLEVLWGVDGFVSKSDGPGVLVSVLGRVLEAGGSGASAVRKSPRYPLTFPIVASVQRSGSTCVLHGQSTDIGMGGIGGRLEGELLPGEVVDLQIFHPDLRSLAPRAQVRHSGHNVCGLEFLDLNPAQQEDLRHALLLAAYA